MVLVSCVVAPPAFPWRMSVKFVMTVSFCPGVSAGIQSRLIKALSREDRRCFDVQETRPTDLPGGS